ncbi:UPF0496 protein At1g20180-like [Salvia miltiorrhiza]|uniref:UPF0496 protein At1g20180-like n=1 Tax=Salvia miltiorrhiza TaxID=226208 RepID=UPI0025ACEFAB|nr:UPF0496 protein At1g20180-like [Salvia miltiorrhiza]
MRKMLCSKLKSPFGNKGTYEKEEDRSSLMSKPNVREEYKEAFRTKSYIDICDKVQSHLVKVTSYDEEKFTASPPPPPHLSQHLLDPHKKPSTSSTSKIPNFHQFFTNYFDITLEACRFCETLLTNINKARKNHLRIKKSIKIIRRISSSSSAADEYLAVHKNLAAFAAQRNPFYTTNAARFLDLRKAHVAMFQELTSTCKKLKRRATAVKLVKKATTVLVLMGFGALVAAVFAFSMHCTAGLAAAPALAVLVLAARKMWRNCGDEKRLEGMADKLDAAARGVFIMVNDFATVSMIVRRLEDEIEHRRFVADVCVRKLGKKETLKEVVREFQMQESWFVEQLEELERQICLCFLNMNRSKRLLVREMV